jgi:RND family efflux transporter MFP subunit
MKCQTIVTVLSLIVLLGTAIVLSTGCGDKADQAGQTATRYHCPMHPTVVADQPGDCPICGMRLVPFEEEKKPEAHATRYICPMHPTVVSENPEDDCPICGMDLVPMEDDEPADSSAAGRSDVPGQAAVSITPQARQAMGLKLDTVRRRDLERDIQTSARIVADETRLHHVTVKVDGWVNELFASITGQEVKHHQPLLTIYSPDLLSAQQEYVTALQTLERTSASADASTRKGAMDLVTSARRRLELWDVSEDQIQRVERTREVEKYVMLYAPMSGIVIERNISAGHNLRAGEVLMTIADLTRVWGDADVYQSDLPYVSVGMPLELSLPYWPDKVFSGKVIFVSPTLDAETRTLNARLEIPNPELLLRPGMYGDATLRYSLGNQLAVPAEAVMFSGKHTYAFKDGGDGRLIPTRIHVGTLGSGWYEVLDGLNEGDRIVVSANFLVDSESSLKAALEAMSGEPAKTEHNH